MIEPQRIGRFLCADEFGHVRPDVAIGLIGEAWKPLVDFVARSLMGRQGVGAVYIRGSIPRGLAIENVSDADFAYFSETNFDAPDFELEKTVKAKFPFVQDLELLRLSRARFDKVHPPQRRPYFQMLVKTQCLFLAGQDVANGIEPFKIGLEMASHVFSLASEYSKLPALLEGARKQGFEQSVRQWFSRRVLRSAFEITMDRSGRFTRDLYLCYEEFAKFYPERSAQMYRVLMNCLNGEDDPLQFREIVRFLTRQSAGLLTR